ncbi:alkylated DNA repair protein [Rhodoplanes roseus]|uniref:Alkylated DNA repair protein n=2 Tax=Rhodoplanes roseus TaxID=29409 RepID=A0A327KRI4_9BRAD|nr:alkylated DNA repair protein [Rhodoplanes roseus]
MRRGQDGAARHRRRKRVWIAIVGSGVLALAGLGAVGWIATAPRRALPPDTDLAAGDAERGALIFAAGDCASCHASPGQSDRHRLGGGLALPSPYGTFRVPNISPHPQDGIGGWRTVDLANALLAGVSPDGRHYYPVFPYTSYARMRLDDVRDLIAYLRTLPPVEGRAPPHEIALPFKLRRVLGIWKLLFLDRTPITPDPTRSAAWNRGHYLAEAVAHCAECHSSRNLFGAIKAKTRYAGGTDPEGVGYVPNITPARIGGWSAADIAEVLRSGRTPNHGRVGSSMTDVVTNTATLPQEDRDAIAEFITSLPPRETPQP